MISKLFVASLVGFTASLGAPSQAQDFLTSPPPLGVLSAMTR